MLCQECPQKNNCTELCEEAEQYVSQDDVPQRELNIGEPVFGLGWPIILKSNEAMQKIKALYRKASPTEKRILSLLMTGLSKEDICQELKITRQIYEVHLSNLKKKIQKP